MSVVNHLDRDRIYNDTSPPTITLVATTVATAVANMNPNFDIEISLVVIDDKIYNICLQDEGCPQNEMPMKNITPLRSWQLN